MPKIYAVAETVENIAKQIIPTYHPHLATARIMYISVDKGSMKAGRPVYGKVRKLSGPLEFLLKADFLMEVAQDHFNELSDEQRSAAVDHLLERCNGTEEEGTGEMIWSTREPDVQEFPTILRRHGAWNADLEGFVSVAKSLGIDELVEDVLAEDETVLTTLSYHVGYQVSPAEVR